LSFEKIAVLFLLPLLLTFTISPSLISDSQVFAQEKSNGKSSDNGKPTDPGKSSSAGKPTDPNHLVQVNQLILANHLVQVNQLILANHLVQVNQHTQEIHMNLKIK
jgi:hypothetical protein